MCRLLAFTSKERKSFYDVIGGDFQDFIELSLEHKDGWGMAHDGQILKEIQPAILSDVLIDASRKVETTGALLHLRQASKGITVNIDNNHPFVFEATTFMHNGTIRPPEMAERFISEKYLALISGTTDSERLFYALLSQVDDIGLVEGVRRIVNLIRESADYSAINIMVQTPEILIAVCEFDESNQSEWSGPDHYQLRYKVEENEVVIASTGWGNTDWNQLENHQILVVDRSTLELSVSSL